MQSHTVSKEAVEGGGQQVKHRKGVDVWHLQITHGQLTSEPGDLPVSKLQSFRLVTRPGLSLFLPQTMPDTTENYLPEWHMSRGAGCFPRQIERLSQLLGDSQKKLSRYFPKFHSAYESWVLHKKAKPQKSFASSDCGALKWIWLRHCNYSSWCSGM